MSPNPGAPEAHSLRHLFLAKCGDPTGHWHELEAAGLINTNLARSYLKVYSQEWEIPLAEPEEEEFVEGVEEEEFGEEAGEKPLRSRVTVPGEDEEPEEEEEEEPRRRRTGPPGPGR